jgi:hypothetical protein
MGFTIKKKAFSLGRYFRNGVNRQPIKQQCVVNIIIGTIQSQTNVSIKQKMITCIRVYPIINIFRKFISSLKFLRAKSQRFFFLLLYVNISIYIKNHLQGYTHCRLTNSFSLTISSVNTVTLRLP